MSGSMTDFEDKNNREYTNGEITVYWFPGKCIHATTCYRELIEVFNPRKRPWVNMTGAPTKEIIRVVDLCPTRALSYKWNREIDNNKSNPEVENKISNEVRVMEDGPLLIKGNFKIFDYKGNELKKMKMASLCRCGQSLNLPFCDGSHRKTGFRAK